MSEKKIKINQVVIDEKIYPRNTVNPKRVELFSENLRDGFIFDTIEVEIHPDDKDKYRILDGAHRFKAFRANGYTEIKVNIRNLDGYCPLLYSASKAIGPQQLTEEEAKQTARRAYFYDSSLKSVDIAKAVGRSRRTVDSYISDLKAVNDLELDTSIFRMKRLGIPSDRIIDRLNIPQRTLTFRYSKIPELIKPIMEDISKGFTVSQVADKYSYTEPMIWSIVLDGKDDIERFKELQWGIQTWDVWNYNKCDQRFGDDWPGRIPAQLVAHILYFFSKQNDLVLDPMSGGGVTSDLCLALNRKCWSFDLTNRPKQRPEIEYHYWDPKNLIWPVKGRFKPDIVVFDPPYFRKKVNEYAEKSISTLSKSKYLSFLKSFFILLHKHTKPECRIAFINADWRDYQNTPAFNENAQSGIFIDEYIDICKQAGWQRTHIIHAPMSNNRFVAGEVSAMQKKKSIGVISRYVIILKKYKT